MHYNIEAANANVCCFSHLAIPGNKVGVAALPSLCFLFEGQSLSLRVHSHALDKFLRPHFMWFKICGFLTFSRRRLGTATAQARK